MDPDDPFSDLTETQRTCIAAAYLVNLRRTSPWLNGNHAFRPHQMSTVEEAALFRHLINEKGQRIWGNPPDPVDGWDEGMEAAFRMEAHPDGFTARAIMETLAPDWTGSFEDLVQLSLETAEM